MLMIMSVVVVCDVGVAFVMYFVGVSNPAGMRFSWGVGGLARVWGIKFWVVGLGSIFENGGVRSFVCVVFGSVMGRGAVVGFFAVIIKNGELV